MKHVILLLALIVQTNLYAQSICKDLSNKINAKINTKLQEQRYLFADKYMPKEFLAIGDKTGEHIAYRFFVLTSTVPGKKDMSDYVFNLEEKMNGKSYMSFGENDYGMMNMMLDAGAIEGRDANIFQSRNSFSEKQIITDLTDSKDAQLDKYNNQIDYVFSRNMMCCVDAQNPSNRITVYRKAMALLKTGGETRFFWKSHDTDFFIDNTTKVIRDNYKLNELQLDIATLRQENPDIEVTILKRNGGVPTYLVIIKK